MEKFSIAVHAGAGPDTEFIREHQKEIKEGLRSAVQKGHQVLKRSGSAVDAVEAAVKELEDNIYFNAGRGAAINSQAEVEMSASIMDGKLIKSGGVTLLKNVKNPVSLAKSLLTNTSYIYLAGQGALDYARKIDIEFMPDSYFFTTHQYDAFERARKEDFQDLQQIGLKKVREKISGTVGAVAVDIKGNVAAATSTGGTPNCKAGRIGDTSVIGAGTYADNKTCAVSCTGDGEYIIRGVIAHSIAQLIKYRKTPLLEACRQILHVDNKDTKGDIGFIAVDAQGNIGIEFNTERMLRAWKKGNKPTGAKIY